MRISRLVLVATLAIAGCSAPAREADTATADTGAAAPAPPPPVAAKAMPAEQPGEIPQDQLLGIWRVTGVMPGAGSSFAKDDPAIIGSMVDITSEALRWSYAASAAFDSKDVCFGPVAGIIDDPAYAERVRQQIAPALGADPASVTRLSAPHEWLCGDGGTLGSAGGGDAPFQRLAEDRLAMRWTGDVTLILTRVRKLPAKAPELPPTGAYEAR